MSGKPRFWLQLRRRHVGPARPALCVEECDGTATARWLTWADVAELERQARALRRGLTDEEMAREDASFGQSGEPVAVEL
jgi:hypothetical protein